MYFELAFVAYVLDLLFGEFGFIRHPVTIFGDYINAYERYFFSDSKVSGFFLLFSCVLLFGALAYQIALFSPFWIESILSSMFLAHHMLYNSVKDVLFAEDKREALSYLVSRDTKDLNQSDINKALIETYSENLSDGVIAPLFYLLLFGFTGIVVYKVVNTLDSMVGYKTKRYENFGYFSAKADDFLNFIPARFTALLIMILNGRFDFSKLCFFAEKHSSPNAGYPITATAIVFDLSLGGDTPYHGRMVKKAYFGDGKKLITKDDLLKSLSVKKPVDIFVLISLAFAIFLKEFI